MTPNVSNLMDVKAMNMRLKKLRKKKGINCMELSEALKERYDYDVHWNTLYQIEYNVDRCRRVRVETIMCLADYYGVTLDWLVTGKEAEPCQKICWRETKSSN